MSKICRFLYDFKSVVTSIKFIEKNNNNLFENFLVIIYIIYFLKPVLYTSLLDNIFYIFFYDIHLGLLRISCFEIKLKYFLKLDLILTCT